MFDWIFDWIRESVIEAAKSEMFPYVLGIAVFYHHLIVLYIGCKIGKMIANRRHKR